MTRAGALEWPGLTVDDVIMAIAVHEVREDDQGTISQRAMDRYQRGHARILRQLFRQHLVRPIRQIGALTP